ncbi:hypothetical protein LZ32DRAFT_384058 [Colletotrichum eremochloae]|nr:hypothetical protein LZ32DRAFT_384058 [Colletotrichum eremochloae]
MLPTIGSLCGRGARSRLGVTRTVLLAQCCSISSSPSARWLVSLRFALPCSLLLLLLAVLRLVSSRSHSLHLCLLPLFCFSSPPKGTDSRSSFPSVPPPTPSSVVTLIFRPLVTSPDFPQSKPLPASRLVTPFLQHHLGLCD